MYEKNAILQKMEREIGAGALIEENDVDSCEHCSRPKLGVRCGACGYVMKGVRVRLTCPDHPRQIFLMDLDRCTLCKQPELMEMDSVELEHLRMDEEEYPRRHSKRRPSYMGPMTTVSPGHLIWSLAKDDFDPAELERSLPGFDAPSFLEVLGTNSFQMQNNSEEAIGMNDKLEQVNKGVEIKTEEAIGTENMIEEAVGKENQAEGAIAKESQAVEAVQTENKAKRATRSGVVRACGRGRALFSGKPGIGSMEVKGRGRGRGRGHYGVVVSDKENAIP